MRTALALFALISLLGCGRPPVPVMAAAVPASPKVQIASIPFLNEVRSSSDATNAVVRWEVIIAEFPADATERFGMARLFEVVGQKNAVIEAERERSGLVEIARANSNIVLNFTSSAYAGSCTIEDSTNLLQVLEKSEGVEILSAPKLTTKGILEGIISISDVQTVVIRGGDTSDPNALVTKQISLGPTVSLRLLNRTEDKIAIEAGVRLEEFGGYQNDPTGTPRPIFSVTAMGTRAELNTNEVLLLGGPIRMKVFNTRDSVAYLSDIPGIGRLFTKTETHTNFNRMLVIVRPRL
jgi:type II secretory pathway component GspD/PulD (secretin)